MSKEYLEDFMISRINIGSKMYIDKGIGYESVIILGITNKNKGLVRIRKSGGIVRDIYVLNLYYAFQIFSNMIG